MLLDRGADLHARNDMALMHAVAKSPAIIRLLLDRGADLHVRDEFALKQAISAGTFDTVRLLLDRGANVHALGDDLRTRLVDHLVRRRRVTLVQRWWRQRRDRRRATAVASIEKAVLHAMYRPGGWGYGAIERRFAACDY